MKKWKIAILAVIVFWLISFFIYPWVDAQLNPFGPVYTLEDLRKNYEENTEAIHLLAQQTNALAVAAPFQLKIENELTLVYLGSPKWIATKSDDRFDSLMLTIGLTEQALEQLEDLLEDADCIEVASGRPCKITFRFSFLSRLSYAVFETPLMTAQIPAYNDSCRYLYHNPKIVFEYGGGAAGRQCFF